MQMRGTPYNFNIPYENMDCGFVLQKELTSRYAFLLCLTKPIRVGNQKYQNLVLETLDDHAVELEFKLSQDDLDARYGGIQKVISKPLSQLFGTVFKTVTGTKVFRPDQFRASNGGYCIRCSIKANQGLLYPMSKSFIFIHKPTVIIKFVDIEVVEFERYKPNANSGMTFNR